MFDCDLLGYTYSIVIYLLTICITEFFLAFLQYRYFTCLLARQDSHPCHVNSPFVLRTHTYTILTNVTPLKRIFATHVLATPRSPQMAYVFGEHDEVLNC